MKKWLLVLFVFVCAQVQAQISAPPDKRNCGATQMREELIRQMPEIKLQMERIRQSAQDLIKSRRSARVNQPIIQIPIVFHVVYNTPKENISDAQILSQLEVLNQDYRRRNADTTKTLPAFKKLAADTGIQFCLATVDPNGQPTNGITRTQTSVAEFSQNHAIKFDNRGGHDAWNSRKYLNIWVGNLQDDYLGLAEYPGGLASIDGVVLDYTAVGKFPANPNGGKYNQGRSATHEIGHWLGLDHIWGLDEEGCDDTDGIDDTPNQDDSNGGCPTGTRVSCNNAALGGDMYQNYMDYTDDACMNLFTHDQAAYMNAIINTARPGLLTAVVCAFPLRADFSANDTIITTGSSVQFSDNSIGLRATNWLWTFEGGTPATSTQQNPVVQFTNPGRHTVTLKVLNGAFTDTKSKEEYIWATYLEPRIYPNPADGYVFIDLPADYEVTEVLLYNAVGQLVRSGVPQSSRLQFKLAGLANGMYYAKIISENGEVITRKILVQK